MKKYLAYHANTTSAITSKEEAHKWAAKQLADRPQLQQIYICEVIEVAARTTPTIETKPFFVELDASTAEETQTLKQKAA